MIDKKTRVRPRTLLKVFVGVAILNLSLAFPSFADQTSEENETPFEELFLTKVGFLQSKGETQMTLLPQFKRAGRASHLPFEIEYGLSDRWEVDFEVSSSLDESDVPKQNLGLGLRYGRRSSTGALSFGVEVAGGDEREAESFVAVAKEIRSGVWLAAHGGLSVERGEDGVGASVSGGIIGRITDQLSMTAEMSWDGREDAIVAAPGILWSFNDAWKSGVAAQFPLRGEDRSPSVALLLSFEFGGDE